MINIADRLHSTATEQTVAGANEIYDDAKGKKQDVINQENDEHFSDLEDESVRVVPQEFTQTEQAQARQNLNTYSKNEVNQIASAFTEQNYVSVQAVAATTAADIATLINATGEGERTDTIYRVGWFDGTAFDVTKYSEYTWNGSSYIQMAVRSTIGEVFDISVYNQSGGTPVQYETLAMALGTNGANVPSGIRRGGMSVKFIQSSDNNYVQFRLMSQSFTTDTTKWQGVIDELKEGSNDLVEAKTIFAGVNGLKVGIDGNAVSGNIRNHIVPRRIINTDGNFVDGWRSLIKVQIIENTTSLQITGISFVRFAFYSSEPDLMFNGDSDAISVTTSSAQPSTIPSGAKWIVFDIAQDSTVSDNVYVTYTNFSKRAFDLLPSININDVRTDGIYRMTLSNGNSAILVVSESGNFQARVYEYNNKLVEEYRKYSNGSWGDFMSYNNVIDASMVDEILPNGVYFYVVNNYSVILSVSNNGLYQSRIYTEFAYSIVHVQIRNYVNNAWTNWTDWLGDKLAYATTNPILKNHTCEEIFWRGTARLYWDSVRQRLYWSNGSTADSDGAMLYLKFNNVNVLLGNSVKERFFDVSGNSQLLLPLNSNEVYDLDDIVVQAGTYYDKNAYVKVAHICFGKAVSSFVVQDYNSDSREIASEALLTTYSFLPDTNYHDQVIIDGNILDTGILGKYNGRGALFFKLPDKGVAPIISGCTILAYQWYSGYPDYSTGSNSLGRTTTNTPPSNAVYCGLTINLANDYSNITIKSQKSEVDNDKEKLATYGSNLNNSVGENCFANGIRTNLKILAYGNSFMRNSIHYLSAIAKNGCNVNLTVGNLYTGGTELQNHYEALLNNTSPYEWHKYVDGVNTVNQNSQTAMRGLLDERWDAIIIHQYIPWQYPFEPTLNQFLKLIIERIGYTPKIYINATWAGSLDNKQTYYGFDTEEEMWQAMLDAVKGACADSGVQEFSIIPTGTAIQNARTLSWADSYNRFVNAADNDWHHLNPAGGFIAACTVFQKIVTPLNGVPCSNTTFRIPTSTSLPPQTAVEEGIIVTDSNYLQLCNAAIDAVNNPFVITEQ